MNEKLGEIMRRRLIKNTAIMTLVISVFCGCSTSKNDVPENIKELPEVKIEKQQVTIHAISYYWAKEDNTGIYYFADKKLWKYDSNTDLNEVVTENLINPYDFAVYEGTIYTLEYDEADSNGLGLFVYDKNHDKFEELMSFDNQVHSIITSGHYLVAATDNEDQYEVYDISTPDNPQKVNEDEVEIVKETPVVEQDEANEKVIYEGQTIADINQLEADIVEVWGWNESYAYICASVQGEDEFYKINLTNTDEITKLADDTAKVAVFEDTILTKNKDGLVEIED